MCATSMHTVCANELTENSYRRVSAAVVTIVVLLIVTTNFTNNKVQPRFSQQINLIVVWCIGVLLWPLLFHATLGMESLNTSKILILPFLWPIALGLFDLMNSDSQTCETEKRWWMSSKTMDANALAGMTFALGSVLSVNMDKRLSQSVTPVLMMALAICIALIIPSPAMSPGSQRHSVVNAVQKVSVHYAIGLLLAAICVYIVKVRSTGAHATEELRKIAQLQQ